MTGIKSFLLSSSSSFFYWLCFTILFFLLGTMVIDSQRLIFQDIFLAQVPDAISNSPDFAQLVDNQVSSSLSDAQLMTLFSALPQVCSTNSSPQDLTMLCKDYKEGKIKSANDIKLFFKNLTLNQSSDLIKTQMRNAFSQLDNTMQLDSNLRFPLFLTSIISLILGFGLSFFIMHDLNQAAYLGFNSLFWSSLSNVAFFSIAYLFGGNILTLLSPLIINTLFSGIPNNQIGIINSVLPKIFDLFLPLVRTISLNFLFYFVPLMIFGLSGKVYFGTKMKKSKN